MDGLTNEQVMRLMVNFAKAADFNQRRDCDIHDKLMEEIARRRATAVTSAPTFPAPPDNWQRFRDGSLKPFLPPSEYDSLRDDDRFLYNRAPKPEGLV